MPADVYAKLLIAVIVAAGLSILLVWALPLPWALPALALIALVARLWLMRRR